MRGKRFLEIICRCVLLVLLPVVAIAVVLFILVWDIYERVTGKKKKWIKIK